MRDVVIVGGGPVGILAGCLLALRGLDVEVLEQRGEPSMRSRAIGIHPPALRALDRAGVAEDLLARAVHIAGGEARCDGHTLGRLSFEEAGTRYPFVAALPQYETEALLRARFEELRPGALRQGVSAHSVQDRGDHVRVTVAQATAREGGAAPSRDETVATRYVVAADGARSTIRQAVGLDFTPLGGRATYLMGDFADSPAGGGDAILYFERGGVVESFPLPGGRRRWVAMTDAFETDATSADLADLIRSRTGVHLPPSADVASPFRVQQHLAKRMVRGRVVLIGDAAHEISPIGGQGMNLGWLDAAALAPVLERALAEPPGADSGLREFDRRRRRAARMAARQAGFNMSMGRPATGVRLRGRNGLVRVLAVPPFRVVLTRAFTMRWL